MLKTSLTLYNLTSMNCLSIFSKEKISLIIFKKKDYKDIFLKMNHWASQVWDKMKVQGLTNICLKLKKKQEPFPLRQFQEERNTKGLSGFVQNKC